MQGAPFNVFDAESSGETCACGHPTVPDGNPARCEGCPYKLDHDGAAVARSEPDPMDWKHGDAMPEDLRPGPGEELAVAPAPDPWPRVVPIEQTHEEAAVPAEPAADVTQPWPALAAAEVVDPTTIEQQPWVTIASESDNQDGYRFRAEQGNDAGGRVVGKTAGFCCRLCYREATHFAWDNGDTKSRDACSPECLHGVDMVLDKMGGETMEQQNLTAMERAAVVEARGDLFRALVAAGLAERFNDATATQMDSVIRAVWDGVRSSMQRQSATGEVPF